MSEYHIPVLLAESISALVTNPDGTYADATFGGGGHTAAILSRLNGDGRVIAFDRDIDAIEGALKDPRLTLIHNNFRFIENYAEQLWREDRSASEGVAERRGIIGGSAPLNEVKAIGHEVFDGILADLGVSSHQFDTAERGFSFRFEDAPLDMRMNREARLNAQEVVNSYPEEDLERVLRLYGEVDGARNMARLIGQARAQDLGPVQAEHGVDDERTIQLDHQLLRRLPRLGETVLGVGHVDVVVDVAVVGGEVPFGDAQGNAAVLAVEMDRRNDHVDTLPF